MPRVPERPTDRQTFVQNTCQTEVADATVASLIQFSGRTAFFALHPSAASMFVALALFGAAAASELPTKAMVLRGGGVSMPQTVIGLTGSALSLSGIATMLE